jgi:lipopolysaccharide export system protein LptA
MILLLLMVPYEIYSGSMEIVDRSKKIFKDTVKVHSEDFHLIAEEAVQTDTFLIFRGNVGVKTKNFSLIADYLNYKIPDEVIFGSGNIKIWREDTLKGDSLIFFRDKEEGKLIGNLVFVADSVEIKGESADFSEDSVIIRGKPEFKSPEIKVESDYTVYVTKDSTYKFLSEVNFETSNIFGNCGRLIYSVRDEISLLLEEPFILENEDSITGEKIFVDHKTMIMKSLNGEVITHTKEGRNIVWGDTIDIFYSKESLDSVFIKGKSRGSFAKNETESGKSNQEIQ